MKSFALPVAAILALSALAQTTNARLDGTVQDATGAVIPNTKLSLVNTRTQARAEGLTDASGNFVFPALQPGLYALTADAPGFRKAVVTNIELAVGGTVTQIIKLEVGQASESVSVEANALTVQSTESQISSAVMLRDIEVLPQLNRQPLTLAIFQPGVQIDVRAGQDATFSRVNGLRQGSNNAKLDGVDVNDAVTPRLGLAMTANNADSVAEFRVVTEGGKAEHGRSAGGQVELITKSGTNEFHGNAYDFLRNTALNANDFFNNQSGGSVPKFIQNIFGASFGGPVMKNKWFVFGNYQGQRTRQEVIRNRTVPTPTALRGIFQYRRDGAIQQYDFGKADPRGIGPDPGLAKLYAQYPAPNNNDLGDGLNSAGFRFNNPVENVNDQFTIRGDYHVSNNHSVFMRWSWFKTSSTDNLNNADATFPGQPTGSQGGTRWGYAIGSNWALTPTLFNEFVMGYQKATSAFLRPNRPEGPVFITNLFTDIPYVANYPSERSSPVITLTDNMTWVRGSHTFKAGGNLRLIRQYGINYLATITGGVAVGVYPSLTAGLGNGNAVPASVGPAGLTAVERQNFDLLYNDILGRVDRSIQGYFSDLTQFLPAGAPRVRNHLIREHGYFFQDDWRVNRKLTLNLGLRWEYYGVPFERDGFQGSIDQAAAINLGGSSTNLTIVPKGRFYNTDWTNFAPRFGFAYDPTGSGKWAIRGNWGIFYDRSIGAALNFIDANTPGFSQLVPVFPNQSGADRRFNEGIPAPPQPSAPVLTLPATRSSNMVIADPNLRTGYVMSYAFNIQRELFRNTILQAGYVGNRGVKLFMDQDVNQPRVFGEFQNSFREIQSFVANSATAVPASNVFVRLFGTPQAAVTALGANNFSQGRVGTIVNAIDTNAANFNRFAGAGLPVNYFRNFPQFAQLIVGTNSGRSYYDSLQVSLHRTAGALQLRANYTWSKSMDNISTEGNGFTTPIDNYNLAINRARSDFDRPHSLNVSAFYHVPFGHGQKFGSAMPRWLDAAVGGWQLGVLQIAQSGQPFTVNSQRLTVAVSGNPALGAWANFNGTDRTIGTVQRRGDGVYFFTPDQVGLFSAPGAFEVGSAGRNTFRNPRFLETDASLVKRFRITERHTVQFRAEAYNVFNTPNFGFTTTGTNVNINNPATFGKFSQTIGTQTTAGSARTMQLALRYDF